ncbi:MAG TPA: FKBP-type peptidyl-prolyl cis-trans isomerase [Streptosporangiaceae bacterium]|nr:FKBP-type peptidyl-prolyl cis-trans isomerase [Streptosporangiaceae bacterium]
MAAALLAPLAVTAALAGCGSQTPASPNASVTVTGPVGKTPTVRIPAAKASSGLVTKTLVKGHGPVLAAGDSYLANFNVYDWHGTTHKLLFSSFTSTPEVLPLQMGLSGLQQALSGQRVGSRVLAVLPPKYGYGAHGNPQIGVAPTDTMVWVVDLIQAFSPTAHATGKQLSNGGGKLPTIKVAAAGGSPTITVPKSAPPGKLVVSTLIKGTGAPVKSGQTIIVRYVGSIWRTGQVFNNNWPSASSPTAPPNAFVLGQLIPGWNTGLVGVPVGSRVMLVVPPAEGYGKNGQKSAGIKPTDTLVFVVDILATA